MTTCCDTGRKSKSFDFLNLPRLGRSAAGWDPARASRYWYKHFAGVVRDGHEPLAPTQFAAALEEQAPPVADL